ncbi:CHAT domain-containing protein [Mycena belliarum]|uniref:CHAT domain-containing protein n=1 Tax=Mycena belliarum TaxID=1033014 RepID=A0AAD6XP73_9AGAR|nr:CHAT domain-containing protein [Mycena belliae]
MAEIQRLKQLIEKAPVGDAELPRYHHMLGAIYKQEYKDFQDLPNLEAALLHYQVAVTLLEELGHPDQSEYLKSLAVAYRDRYRELDDLEDLNLAIKWGQESIALLHGHPGTAGRLQSLAVSFTARYRKLGTLDDLEAAVQMDNQAVQLTELGDPDRIKPLQNLSVSLTDRFHRLGEMKDLEAALKLDQEILDSDPERPEYLQSLAVSFTNRFQRLGDPADLNKAFHLHEEAVKHTPENHPERAGHLQGLALSLEDRYRLLGDLNDLEAALMIGKDVVSMTVGHPKQVQFQHSLGSTFGNRYRQLGNLSDLEDALHHFQAAVDATPDGHQDKAYYLQSLAMCHGDRYKRFGELGDLDAALHNGQTAVDFTAEDHPDRITYLGSLSGFLEQRYQRFGDPNDLENALEMIDEAVDNTPDGHPDKCEYLLGLAALLQLSYCRFGDLVDLEEALRTNQALDELTKNGHPKRANYLSSLAASYIHRYQRLGALSDLEAALQKDREAVHIPATANHDKAKYLQNLAAALTHRYLRLHDLKDLEAAVQADQEGFELIPKGHVDRGAYLHNVALCAIHRYRKFNNPADAEIVHKSYIASFEASSLNPEAAWGQALVWASFAKEFQPSDCVPAYTAGFRLLPEILWIGHTIPIRQNTILRLNIGQTTSMATRTCIELSNQSLTLNAAVEIMEQGLATEFQKLLQLTPDLEKLQSEDAELLQNLSCQLYSGRAPHSLHIVNEWDQLVKKIQKQPGLEHFLQPKPYDVLCHASRGGPIVMLNSHKNGCDAIIIVNPASEPVNVPLVDVGIDHLKFQRAMLKKLLGHCNVRTRGDSASSRLFGQEEHFVAKSTSECFADLLSWLWTHIVSHIYHALELVVYNGRLWWLPTGEFTGLPLHASPPIDKFNQFIHSYTATLGSLVESYTKKQTQNAPKLGVVGVTHTDPSGMNMLKGVKKEVQNIMAIVKGPLDCLEGEQATPESVKLQVQECSWVHLACHGKQDLIEPSQSHLLLYGGSLELETILQTPLPNAEFVFLAACQTAMGDADLVNESFHLGGGLIAAGFRSAVGTMWAMNDLDGPLVAQIFYSHLFRDGRQPKAGDTAEALQVAVNELRDRKVPHERWIPFMHMGI